MYQTIQFIYSYYSYVFTVRILSNVLSTTRCTDKYHGDGFSAFDTIKVAAADAFALAQSLVNMQRHLCRASSTLGFIAAVG